MEFVKGELSVKDTNEHGDYYIGNKDSYSYIAIVVAEVLSPENSAEEYAQEFVRRWNAFENLWDSINIKRHNGICAWRKNPVVKVIEFRNITEVVKP